jgi:hypothetical protein
MAVSPNIASEVPDSQVDTILFASFLNERGQSPHCKNRIWERHFQKISPLTRRDEKGKIIQR